MQGQSGYTKFKEARFTPILAQSLKISKAAPVAHHAYYHVDLHAGSGYNADAGVNGSPLNFLQAAARHARPHFYAFFVDQDPTCIQTLIRQPDVEEASDRVCLYATDNTEVLPIVHEFIRQRERRPEFAMGTVLIDPNGYHKSVPWPELQTFCHAHPRIDVLMNLNVRTYRLERPHIKRGAWSAYTLRPISSFPAWFARPNWMITELCQIAGSSWVQLVGRTIATREADYKSLGFYALTSSHGRQIVADIEGRDDAPPAPTHEPTLLYDL